MQQYNSSTGRAQLFCAIPYLKGIELKRLMLYDAKKVQLGETRLCRELWSRFVRRSWELSMGLVFPTNKKVGRRCHVRTVLRFLQAIASVQYYPEEVGGDGLYFSVARQEHQIAQVDHDEQDASSCTSSTSPSSCGIKNEQQQQKMVDDMFLRCMVAEKNNALKRQEYVFLLNALARLRLNTPDLMCQKILQKMSIVWPLLRQEQLVLAANCCAKLSLGGSSAWAKPLSDALEMALFGNVQERRLVGTKSHSHSHQVLLGKTQENDFSDCAEDLPPLLVDTGRMNGVPGTSIAEGLDDQEDLPVVDNLTPHAPWRARENVHGVDGSFGTASSSLHLPGAEGVAGSEQGFGPEVVERFHHPEERSTAKKSIFYYDMLGHDQEEKVVSPMKRQLVLRQLKAITVLELIPHRVPDVIRLYLDQQNGPNRRQANDRNLVLFELYLRAYLMSNDNEVSQEHEHHDYYQDHRRPSLYETVLSAQERMQLENRRDLFYEKTGMTEEEEGEEREEEAIVLQEVENRGESSCAAPATVDAPSGEKMMKGSSKTSSTSSLTSISQAIFEINGQVWCTSLELMAGNYGMNKSASSVGAPTQRTTKFLRYSDGGARGNKKNFCDDRREEEALLMQDSSTSDSCPASGSRDHREETTTRVGSPVVNLIESRVSAGPYSLDYFHAETKTVIDLLILMGQLHDQKFCASCLKNPLCVLQRGKETVTCEAKRILKRSSGIYSKKTR
ncbi:unnamed protein product [Amoebophrya sp. A120]|nr:unnamed protein product [Amoebophrya sp. A120]|eukprot:GSA120T00009119001.1